jgi:hypothetical protein
LRVEGVARAKCKYSRPDPVGEHSILETDFAACILLAGHLPQLAAQRSSVEILESLEPDLGRASDELRDLSAVAWVNLPSAARGERLQVPARALQALKLAQGGVPLLTSYRDAAALRQAPWAAVPPPPPSTRPSHHRCWLRPIWLWMFKAEWTAHHLRRPGPTMSGGAPAQPVPANPVRVIPVWFPPDPDEPTSELYRLMPPLRPGDDGDPVVLISPDLPRWRTLAAKARPASRRAFV